MIGVCFTTTPTGLWQGKPVGATEEELTVSSIVEAPSGVHVVRVRTPEGAIHEVRMREVCGLKRALKIATTLAGWFGVSDWESASAFTPKGVRRVLSQLLAIDPDLDIAECVVEVATRAESGSDVVNGWEVMVSYRPLSVIPELVKDIRLQAGDGDWREDVGSAVAGPHFAAQVPTGS